MLKYHSMVQNWQVLTPWHALHMLPFSQDEIIIKQEDTNLEFRWQRSPACHAHSTCSNHRQSYCYINSMWFVIKEVSLCDVGTHQASWCTLQIWCSCDKGLRYLMYGCSLDALSKASTMYVEHTVRSHVHFIIAFSLVCCMGTSR